MTSARKTDEEFLGYPFSLEHLDSIRDRRKVADLVDLPSGWSDRLVGDRISGQIGKARDAAAGVRGGERAAAETRSAMEAARAANERLRTELAKKAREAREAADDATSRRLAREQDQIAAKAEADIADTHAADLANERRLLLTESHVAMFRMKAHKARADALRFIADALACDLAAESRDAARAAQAEEARAKRLSRKAEGKHHLRVVDPQTEAA